jgi:tripartite-type tricarboxylate transporter receptor subunit TctC
LACALALLAASDQVAAQSWPARPIKFIVSQAAGGTPDIICRLIAEKLSRALGQQVVVDNKPGGGNIIGAQTAARSAPDGYTFFFATAAALVTNPYTFKSLPYDPARDFVPVSMVASNPFFLLANPGLPAKTLQELIALDKAEPGRLLAATDGQRNFSGMLTAWFNKRAGTTSSVPYATCHGHAGRACRARAAHRARVPSARHCGARGCVRWRDFAQALAGTRNMPAISSLPGLTSSAGSRWWRRREPRSR